MALVYSGEITLGAACPIVVSGTASSVADLQSRLAGAMSLQASLHVTPPSISTQITFLTTFLAQLQSALTLGVPAVSYDLSATAALIASLTAALGVLATLQGLLSTGEVFAYAYSGRGDGLGPSLTTELATQWPDGTPGSHASNAVILGTVSPSTWTAMASFFGGV